MIKITDSQWSVMEILWESSEALTVSQICDRLEQERGICWNRNTVNTFLTRLAENQVVACAEAVPKMYYALLGRETCVRSEQKSFLNKIYQGSIKTMIASLLKDNDLSEEEVEEIRQLLVEDTRE